jgi:hypothetical protein
VRSLSRPTRVKRLKLALMNGTRAKKILEDMIEEDDRLFDEYAPRYEGRTSFAAVGGALMQGFGRGIAVSPCSP